MKNILITCLFTLTSLAYAHTLDNPYYAFIKKYTSPFVRSLSPDEVVPCLQFLSGGDGTQPNDDWFKRLVFYCEYMWSRFSDGYDACDNENMIKYKNKEERRNEFGIYVMTGLYRIVYNHACNHNINLNPENKSVPLMHPDDFDAEWLLLIHE